MGWVDGGPPRAPRGKRAPVVEQTAPASGPITIPDLDFFYPAHIVHILKRHGLGAERQLVHYWIDNYKITSKRDYFKMAYVERQDLVDFVREFLKRECQ